MMYVRACRYAVAGEDNPWRRVRRATVATPTPGTRQTTVPETFTSLV